MQRLALDQAKDTCRQIAAVLSAALESEVSGAAGAKPGEERFVRMFTALAKAGELYPHLERGLPGRLHFTQPPMQRSQPSSSVQATTFSSAIFPGSSDAAFLGLARKGLSASGVNFNATANLESHDRLDHLDWCKAAQIWLLELAGDWREVETICWRPGLWGPSSARHLASLDDGRRLRDHLASFLQERGQPRAVGLLLASLGKPERALEVWMEEYYVQSSASLDRHGSLGHEVCNASSSSINSPSLVCSKSHDAGTG
jgi:hypothetical protein